MGTSTESLKRNRSLSCVKEFLASDKCSEARLNEPRSIVKNLTPPHI